MERIKLKNRDFIWTASILVWILVGAGPALGFDTRLMVAKGKIRQIEGNTVILDSLSKYEPANERAQVPDWARPGVTVKIGYYSQKYIRYYFEIVKPGEKLKAIEDRSGIRAQDR